MKPPPFSALKRGSTLVNIILKADQPTGKLTTGVVAEILTRGDHPRGVKVRLVDGRVGRVQRILENRGSTPAAAVAGEEVGAMTGTSGENGDSRTVYGSARGNRRDHLDSSLRRQEDSAVMTGSLMDFVKPPKQKRRRGGRAEGVVGGEGNGDENGDGSGGLKSDGNDDAGGGDDGTAPAQRLLEAEFPSLDTALVAAILLDHEGDVGAARVTLEALM